MKFSEFLVAAIQRSEIPLRFEPGAEEAVARPVIEFLKAWIDAHDPAEPKSDFDYGRRALVRDLLAELDGTSEIPD